MSSSSEYVDPDPFVIAGLGLAAASVILQFVQTYKAFRPTPPARSADNLRQQLPLCLQHLEKSSREIRDAVKIVSKMIEQASQDPEYEYYAAPARIGTTALNLKRESMHPISQSIANIANQTGHLTTWSYLVIALNPETAYNIGAKIDAAAPDAADALNKVMAEGRPTREILQELRLLATELERAAEAEGDATN